MTNRKANEDETGTNITDNYGTMPEFTKNYLKGSTICVKLYAYKYWILYGVGVIVLATLIGVTLGLTLPHNAPISNMQKANDLLETVPLIDGHNDLAWQYYCNARNLVDQVDLEQDLRTVWSPPVCPSPSCTDIPRLREGRVGAQFWAAYVSCSFQYKDAIRQTLEQIDVIYRFVKKYSDTFELVTTANGIKDAFSNKKIASLIGVEGGHSIDSSLATLRLFYTLGVRYMTLTHTCSTPWADASTVEEDQAAVKVGGLSEFGKRIVREMNRIGMMVDLSHVSPDVMRDALDVSTAPVIFSHSSAYSLCNHHRNVPDHILTRVKENQGVVMVNFFPDYVTCSPVANITDVVAHIEYIKEKAGINSVGIGADYDGIPRYPIGLEDVSGYPRLFEELLNRGWNEEDLKKLAGANLLRVMEQVEKISHIDKAVEEGWIEDSAISNNTCRVSYPYKSSLSK